MKLLDTINDFMNDSDRGPGHGIMQGAFYGLIFLAVESILALLLPFWAICICWAVLATANHVRVIYQENILEGWASKEKTFDYVFDVAFRPLQADAISALIFIPSWAWCPWIIFSILLGYKNKKDRPFFIFWRG